jgi:CRP/FNR family transcriptional regulator, cyclic AMP receptor protein
MTDRGLRVRHALAQVPWLAACGDAVVSALAADAGLEQVADGTTVAWRGRETDHLLVVASGALELSMTSPAGKRHVTNRLGPGQVFGLIPVLDEVPWIHDATAKGASEAVRVPRASLLAAMQTYPQLSVQIVHLLCSRARSLYEALASQSLMSLPVRVARVLAGQFHGPDARTLTMPQADLADMLGVTRQSLNVELRHLERAGVLRLGRGRISLLDRPALERLAGLVD